MKNAKLAIGVVLACSTFLGIGTSLAADWPQWRGTNRDAKVTEFTPPSSWPKELTAKWKVTVGVGDASPALVDGKLFVFTRQDNDEVTTCLDATSGKQVWQDKYAPNMAVTGAAAQHPGPRSSPAVADGKVVTLGVGEMLSCLDAGTGKVLWRKEFSKEFAKTWPQFYTATSPIIVNGMCIAHLGGQGAGAVMAFDLTTGDVKWKWAGDSPAYASPVLMTVDGSRQVVEVSDKVIVGLAAADGKLLWQSPLATGGGRMSNTTASPVIDGQTVIFMRTGMGTKAIKIEKHGDEFATTELWTNKDISTQYNTPVLKDGLLYGLSDKGSFFCMDEKTGKIVWSETGKHNGNFGSTVDAGPDVLALTSDSQLTVIKPGEAAYTELAKIKVAPTQTYAYPIVSGSQLFIKDKDSVMMYALKGE